MSSFSIGEDEGGPFIICDACGKKSYHPSDVQARYCGNCHDYHEVKGAGMYLLPCAPNVCQECAVDHEPEFPHNQQSLYYQYHFYALNNRWPTWEDAMAHCDEQMQEFWKIELREKGVKI
jgi:hypothetical protein